MYVSDYERKKYKLSTMKNVSVSFELAPLQLKRLFIKNNGENYI